jgi:hypothetical protein
VVERGIAEMQVILRSLFRSREGADFLLFARFAIKEIWIIWPWIVHDSVVHFAWARADFQGIIELAAIRLSVGFIIESNHGQSLPAGRWYCLLAGSRVSIRGAGFTYIPMLSALTCSL